MLGRLSVENYALIEKLDLELSDSLNIITGETGAGKSILLGALSLLLGGKADGATMLSGEKNCIIEGAFSLAGYDLKPFFEENDLEWDDTSIVRRVITASGKSRAYINDLPVQLTTLRELGSKLIDIHSQHQSQMIADDGFRTGIVDSVASHAGLLTQYREAHTELKGAERKLASLRKNAEENTKDEEYVRFQLEQLTAAALTPDEQPRLEEELNELSHAGQIREAMVGAAGQLDHEQTGALVQLKTIEQSLSKLEEVYPKAGELSDRVHSAREELKDIYSELSSEGERVESNPQRLDYVTGRLNMIYSLQQKHRVSSVVELLELQEQYEEKLLLITNFDEAIAQAKKRIETSRKHAAALAEKISKNRTKAAVEVEKYVTGILAKLGMPNGRLSVVIAPAQDLRPSGADNIGFLFSANKNIAPQPLEKVASGGEISRVMLALKSLVAKTAKLPTIIFDEIDTGVSGQIADAMGEIINELSRSMQVVNITHLPQVASKGRTHFLVYKDNSGKSSRTQISLLAPDARVNEIAKMLSGSTITDAALQQARLLLGHSLSDS